MVIETKLDLTGLCRERDKSPSPFKRTKGARQEPHLNALPRDIHISRAKGLLDSLKVDF